MTQANFRAYRCIFNIQHSHVFGLVFNIITQRCSYRVLAVLSSCLESRDSGSKRLLRNFSEVPGVIECKPITIHKLVSPFTALGGGAGKGEAKTYSVLLLSEYLYLYICISKKMETLKLAVFSEGKQQVRINTKLNRKDWIQNQVELAKNNPHTFYHIMTPTALQSMASTAAHVVKRHETH